MARWGYGLGVIAGASVWVFAIASACLPDLSLNLCGNGYIDENEQCDPGANTNPGCTSNCQILCQAMSPNDTRAYYYDPATHHCYFSAAGAQIYVDAVHACSHGEGAHLVTLVDDDELGDVVTNFLTTWSSKTPRFWVGLSASSDQGMPYVAAAPHEPGWDVTSVCAGCFLHGVGANGPVIVDGGAPPDTGPPQLYDIVATDLTTGGAATMAVVGTNAAADTVCEREPVGARSVPCFNGSFCFTVLETAVPPPGKSKGYLFNPAFLTASDAEAACRALTDAGKASLVVFESRSEREQVSYELSQIPLLQKGLHEVPPKFWIGLRTIPVDGGFDWEWDDGTRASPTSTGPRPSVWGDSQGRVHGASQAYIRFQGNYDDGLAYTYADSANETLPYVCQYE